MSAQKATTWKLELTLPDEHRIFRSGEDLAIADLSGDAPDQTDDGVLLLDHDRVLLVFGRAGDEHYAIPLRDAAGSPTRTPTDAATLLLLSARYNWPIRVARSDMRVSDEYVAVTHRGSRS